MRDEPQRSKVRKRLFVGVRKLTPTDGERRGRRIYIVNPLAAYSYTLGWRTVPGVRWAANQIGQPEEAIRFEAEIGDWIITADELNGTLCAYPAARFLSMAEADLIGPHLLQLRTLCETVTKMFEARGVV